MQRDPETEKNGVTRELCAKQEQVEVRKRILLNTDYVQDPKPNILLFLYDVILITF